MTRRWAVVPCAAAIVLAGCGGSDDPRAAPAPTASAAQPTAAAACVGASMPSRVSWPASFPDDLPKPPSATKATLVPAAGVPGLSIVRFTTTTSIREGILFAVDRIPKAGFTLGRGDAEAFEADAPFSRGGVRGLYRMAYGGPCRTQWLVAVAKVGGTTPLLPTPSSSPSPLPFGP